MNDTAKSPAAFIPFHVPTAPAPAQFAQDAGPPTEPVLPRRKGRPPKLETLHTDPPTKKTRKPRADKHALGAAAVKMGLARTRQKPRAIKSKDDVATGMKIDATTLLNASAGLDHSESAVLSNMILELAQLSKSARPRVVRALASLFKE